MTGADHLWTAGSLVSLVAARPTCKYPLYPPDALEIMQLFVTISLLSSPPKACSPVHCAALFCVESML